MVLWAEDVVKVFIVNIHPPGKTIFFCFGAGIAGRENAAAFENSLADPGSFAGAVRHNGLVLRVHFTQFIIERIEGCAVMDISRGDVDAKNKVMFVAGGVRFIGKAFLVFPL